MLDDNITIGGVLYCMVLRASVASIPVPTNILIP